MKAQELRIGNLVRTISEESEVLKIEAIKIFDKTTDSDCVRLESFTKWLEIDCIEPIIITEDWLIKLGFGCIPQIKEEYFRNCLSFNIKDNICFFETDCQPEYFNHIKYLHQLQNFYFLLTNQELEINETKKV
jgi:hypothetical protein